MAGGHGVLEAPFAIGLTADDPLPSVVVARVADEHQLGLELVLRLKDEPPSAMLHADAADIGTGHSWADKEDSLINCGVHTGRKESIAGDWQTIMDPELQSPGRSGNA